MNAKFNFLSGPVISFNVSQVLEKKEYYTFNRYRPHIHHLVLCSSFIVLFKYPTLLQFYLFLLEVFFEQISLHKF